jgi:putative PIN family toxin of toxin-antitoxin system
MRILRVVLDTNVLVAAARSNQGASFAILQAMRKRQFVALISVPLMLEYEAVLTRPEQLQASGRTVRTASAFLDAFCKLSTPVHLHFLWRPQTRDPADEMVLETALNGSANALVTLNPKDFVTNRTFNVKLWSPAEFLEQLRKDKRHG